MSNYTVRQFEEKDYPTLVRWFEQWGWDAWDMDIISPYSYLVEFKGDPVLFTSFYKGEGCSFGNMGFTISDKDIGKLVAGRAISKGLDHVKQEAEKSGIKCLQYATDTESKVMVDFFCKKGGEITDHGDAYIAIMGLNGFDTDFYYEGKK